MKASKFTEKQIIGLLREAMGDESVLPVSLDEWRSPGVQA